MVILGLQLFACTAGRVSFQQAEKFHKEEKYIEAVNHYMKAVKENPNEARYRLKLIEALLEASNYFYRLALSHKKNNNYQLAVMELNRSLEYNPSNNLAKLEKRALLKLMEGPKRPVDKTWIEQIKEKTSLERVFFREKDEARMNLIFSRKVPLVEIFNSVANTFKINIMFDRQFRDKQMALRLQDVTLSQALDRICMLENLFYKVLDEKTIMIIPDTPAKRKIYDEQIIKNYYLSNIAAADCVKLITKLAKVKTIVSDENHNTITVRDIPEKVALVERLIEFYDKRKPEVMIKVDIMEVNKDRLAEFGIEFSQYQVTQSLTGTGDTGAIKGNRFYYLDSSDFSFTIPTVIYKLLESDSDSKVIARPQVRGEDGEKINIKLGDKVPFPRTSFIPFATGGVEQQPITSYDLQDVGIEVTITPWVHHNAEVGLELDFKLTFITSPGTSTLPPTIGNRSVKTRIRLNDGETGIIAGLLRDSERFSRRGFPGLSRIPILGDIFSSNRRQVTQTDIILRVTPYIMRMPDIRERDLVPIESGTEDNIGIKIGRQLKGEAANSKDKKGKKGKNQ
jgi:general secretion pathway protein D